MPRLRKPYQVIGRIFVFAYEHNTVKFGLASFASAKAQRTHTVFTVQGRPAVTHGYIFLIPRLVRRDE
eukprot:5752610-Prymnesium_polylepis.1